MINSRNDSKVIKRNRIILIGMVLCLAVSLMTGFARTPVTGPAPPPFAAFDFTPVDGSFDVKWRRGPKDDLRASDLENYRIVLQLPNPADFDYSFDLKVMAGAVQIGVIDVTIPQGQTNASTVYRSNAGAKITPSGASDLTNGQFWLGCTTPKGNLRGNAGKTDNNQANVVLRVGGDNRASPTHLIACVAS